MFTGRVSDETFNAVRGAAHAIGDEVVADGDFSVSRVIVIPELVLADSKMLTSLGLQADGSALTDWDASSLLLYELKEVLRGR